ncbi:hypothetical protein NFI96_008436 [Prochilodus magdalenae]|nr:hypothetical protein NFI96_008436 [Prochilodus magdalenae]
MLSGKLQMGLDMYWLKQEDTPGAAGFAPTVDLFTPACWPIVDSLLRAWCRFAECNLTAQSLETLSAALGKENSLKELDLSNSDLHDSGLEKLSAGLKSSHCKLEILRLAVCKLSYQSCDVLGSVLQTETCLKELDLNKNDLQDSGMEKLFVGLKSSHCKLEVLRRENLGSLLKLENSSLKELDHSNNDVQDSGVELLSAGLKSLYCKLEILRLSGCMITEKGCSSLASALSSNSSHLKELDLTYNHPGQSGVKLISARLEDPQCALKTLRFTLPSLVSFDSSLVLAMVEFGVWLFEAVDRCLLYRTAKAKVANVNENVQLVHVGVEQSNDEEHCHLVVKHDTT